jgi:soluble lytic murein transglycosylase-like protein
MRRIFLCASCLVGAFLFPLTRPAVAAATPLAEFLHERNLLAPGIDQMNLLPTAQLDPTSFLGHVFELPVTVSGLMSANGQETAMLTVSPQETVSVRIPSALADTPWFSDTGSQLRVLIKIDTTGNDQSLSNLTLLTAAPEADVESAEQKAAAQASAARLRLEERAGRKEQLASRSLEYQRMPTDWNNTAPVAALPAAALVIYPAYRNAVHHLNPSLSESELNTITTCILGFSDLYHVDPRLVIAMMIAESGFHINSTSCTGAMGLGQLMPETARGLGVTNAYDPVQNIEGSVRLLREHLQQYGGRISLTMAAYNAGPGAVSKYHGVPPYRETENYVAKVASLYRQLCGN